MNTFKVLGVAGHWDEKGRHFPQGSTITTARDLAASFGSGMFELVGPASKVINIAPPAAPQPEEAQTPPPAAPEAEKPGLGQGQPAPEEGKEEPELKQPDSKARKELGEDVTASFPLAVENEFKVFKGTGGWHYVTEPETPKKALNPKALKADAVDAFIKTLLK